MASQNPQLTTIIQWLLILGGALCTTFSNRLPEVYQDIGLFVGISAFITVAPIFIYHYLVKYFEKKAWLLIPTVLVYVLIEAITGYILFYTPPPSLTILPPETVEVIQYEVKEEEKTKETEGTIYKEIYAIGIKNTSSEKKTIEDVQIKSHASLAHKRNGIQSWNKETDLQNMTIYRTGATKINLNPGEIAYFEIGFSHSNFPIYTSGYKLAGSIHIIPSSKFKSHMRRAEKGPDFVYFQNIKTDDQGFTIQYGAPLKDKEFIIPVSNFMIYAKDLPPQTIQITPRLNKQNRLEFDMQLIDSETANKLGK